MRMHSLVNAILHNIPVRQRDHEQLIRQYLEPFCKRRLRQDIPHIFPETFERSLPETVACVMSCLSAVLLGRKTGSGVKFKTEHVVHVLPAPDQAHLRAIEQYLCGQGARVIVR